MIKNLKLRIGLLALLASAQFYLFAGDVEKAFKYLNTGDYANAQKYLLEAWHDEPGNAAVNFGLAKFYFQQDNKQYNLDSANVYIKRAASKIPLNPDDKQTKRFLALGVRDYTIQALQREINHAAYNADEKQNTVESYQHYLDNFTDSGLLYQAVNMRNQLAYIRARGKNNPQALSEFIGKYPNADQVKEAKDLQEKLQYEQTTSDKTYQSYKKYLDQYPKGTYVKEAKKNYEDNLLLYYNQRHTLNGYVEFSNNYKEHPAIGSVQDSIYVMATANGTIEAFKNFIFAYKDNRNVNTAWTQLYILSTAEGTEEAYRRFLNEYPEFPETARLKRDIELSKLELRPIKAGNKWGYVKQVGDDSMVTAIPPEYEEAFAFKCGVAAVRSVPCDSVKCTYYYIDKGNARAIPGNFNYAGDFDGGHAIAAIGKCEVDSCKYGIIDKRGKWFVQPVYDELDDPSDGLCVVSRDEKYGFINPKGDVVISLKYTSATGFSEQAAAVELDTSWFFIDTTGRQLFLDFFHDVSVFKGGLCAATKDGDNWGYIDKTGSFVIPPEYEDAGDFEGGFALVSKKEKDPKHKDLFISQRFKIDKSGKVIEKLAAPKQPAKKGGTKRKGRG